MNARGVIRGRAAKLDNFKIAIVLHKLTQDMRDLQSLIPSDKDPMTREFAAFFMHMTSLTAKVLDEL